MLHGQVYIVSAPAFRGPIYGVMTCVQLQARSQGGFGGFERTTPQGEKVQLCGSTVKVPANPVLVFPAFNMVLIHV